MRCVVEPDVHAFADRVVPFLSRLPVEHSVILTVLDARLRGLVVDDERPVCAYAVEESGEIAGVALRTPPRYTLLSAMPEAAVTVLEESLSVADPTAPGVNGPVALALRFAEARAARTSGTAGAPREGMAMRQYVLGDLLAPTGVPGKSRVAGKPDLPLLVRWSLDMAAETSAGPANAAATEREIASRLHRGVLYLWTVDGEPVSMAGTVGPLVGVSRIGPVYTPPEHRRRGYGAAVTATAAAGATAAGARAVMLYTDLSNPTSNSIYQRMGFRQLGDAQEYLLPARHQPGH